MGRLKWSIQAAQDVEEICKFIAKDVLNAVKRLDSFPNSGRTVPELADKTIREIILGNYRIIYRVKRDIVEILTVYHSARLLEKDKYK